MKMTRSKFNGEELFSMPAMTGDLVSHYPLDLSVGSNVRPSDFWKFDRPAEFLVVGKFSDLPSWFTPHPTEMSGEVAETMIPKIRGQTVFPEPVYLPNAWRFMHGDRIVYVCDRPWTDPTENGWTIEMEESALVYWQLPNGSLPKILDASGALPTDDDEKLKRWIQSASAKIAAMGCPRSAALE